MKTSCMRSGIFCGYFSSQNFIASILQSCKILMQILIKSKEIVNVDSVIILFRCLNTSKSPLKNICLQICMSSKFSVRCLQYSIGAETSIISFRINSSDELMFFYFLLPRDCLLVSLLNNFTAVYFKQVLKRLDLPLSFVLKSISFQ